MSGSPVSSRAGTPSSAGLAASTSNHLSHPPPPAQAPSSTPKPPTAKPKTSQSTSRRPGRSSAPDYLSDRATAAFIRRTLCPQNSGDKERTASAPIEELLPPLTSRNDVDLQLYAILAVIVREFVQSWYGKITPDEAFVAEILQIIAHCTRALEQRLRKVDLEGLLFDEIPDLLDRHIAARRASRYSMARPPMDVDPREIYHSLCPLPFLSPVPKVDAPETIASQRENEAAYRQLLVQGVLAILLPTEDLSNPCLTAVVGDILAETVIGNAIANKASQPWLLYEALFILANKLGKPKRRRNGRNGRNGSGEASHHRSGSQSNPGGQPGRPAGQSFSAQGFLFTALHWVFLAYSAIRMLVTTLASASSFPQRAGRSVDASETRYLTDPPTARVSDNTSFAGSSLAGDEPVKVPIAAFRIWSCMASMIELQDRMPWLGGALSMIQLGLLDGPGQIANLDGLVDRTLSHFIRQSVLNPSLLPPLLRTLRAALFPNNAPGKPTLVPPADDEQLLALRRRSAASLASLVPPWVTSLYFCGRAPWRSAPPRQADQEGGQATTNPNPATKSSHSNTNSPSPSLPPSGGVGGVGEVEPEVVGALDDVFLDLFSDEYCNKHLMYSILDLVVVRLVPELAEKRVSDLWGERLS